MRTFGRLARWALWIVAVVVVVAGGAFLILTRTDAGATFAVRQGVGLLGDRVRGTVRVERVSTTDLLEGVTLRGVEVTGPDGRPFLRADSVSARYSAAGFLAGSFVFREVRVWAPRLVVERLHGQDELNVNRIVPPGPPRPDTARPQARPGSGPRVVFRDVRIEDGDLEVLLPVPDAADVDSAAVTEPAPDGRLLRRYGFRQIRASLPRVAVLEPGVDGESVDVASLAVVVEALREPVRIDEFRGAVRRIGSSATIRAGTLRVGDSSVTGTFAVDWADELRLTGDLGPGEASLVDLRWLLPALPDADARFSGLEFALDGDGSAWDVDDGRLRTDESRVEVSGGVDVAGTGSVTFRGLHLRAAPLAVFRLDPWLDPSPPLTGRVRGEVTLDGPLERVSLGGRLTLEEPGYRPTTAVMEGAVRLTDGFEADGLEILVEPLDWRLARILAPGVELEGGGSLELDLDGSLAAGLSVEAEAQHEEPALGGSDVDVQGTVRSSDGDVGLDLDLDVDRLALGALRGMASGAALEGAVEGAVRIRGRLRDLRVEGELSSGRGGLSFDGRFDATDLAAGYRVDGELDAFDLSGLVGALPEPTVASGTVTARGRGLRAEALVGEARIRLQDSRVGRLAVDSAEIGVRTEDGFLRVDTVEAATNLARISGGGRLGLRSAAGDGELRLSLRNDSVATVQSLVFGEEVIAGDTLTALEREVLRTDGIDPDTLPSATSVALDGRYRADLVLRGGVSDFDVEGTLTVEELLYGPNFVQGARAGFDVEGLPGLGGRMSLSLSADSVRWNERRFAGGEAEVEYRRPEGRLSATLRRSETEDYRARAAFEADSLGGVVHLDELVLRFDPVRWNLGGPASLAWSEDGVTVNDFQLVRSGEDGMRVRADGRLPFRGAADFELDVRRLDLGRLGLLAQSEEEIGGMLDLELRVSGTAADPRMEGTVGVDSLRFRGARMSRVDGDLRYADRRIRGTLEAWRDSVRAARVNGEVPVDLAFGEVEDRIPDEPMDFSVAVDAFPLAILATPVDAVDDVRGTVAGEVRFRGTPGTPEPGGSFQVSGGAFTLPGLGIRPVDVEGSVALVRDAVARVDLRARSRGDATVQGTVDLEDGSNPRFDLTIRTSGFQAVDRRDMAARLGGETTLTGTFRQPVVAGGVRVSRGTLYLEEFERSAQVVDLSDPQFFDVVDTTLVSIQPVLEESRSPFLQNLRVNVEVSVDQDTWLRSRDMNVEMGGELTINFDRTSEELVLLGQLNAIRGTYSAFGRQFQVREGTVEFVGTPGLNPNLNIEAVSRLRTGQGEPLTITATVSGTLLEPRLSLGSDAQPPIAQSDLVSYLIFGRPSYALGSGESEVVQGAAGQLLGAAREGVVTLGLGALANQLGSVVRETGLADYFAVTEAPGATTAGGGTFGGSVASTQVEAGWYLRQNLFTVLMLRPLAGQGAGGGGSRNPVAGARLEWHLGDVWTVEGFVEDRFQRSRLFSFGDIGLQTSQIFGFFVYRDWGY